MQFVVPKIAETLKIENKSLEDLFEKDSSEDYET